MAASATPSASTVLIVVAFSPRPKAAWKSCAIGPMCRTAASCVVKFHVASGSRATRASTARPSTATMLALVARSLVQAHDPPPAPP